MERLVAAVQFEPEPNEDEENFDEEEQEGDEPIPQEG